MFVLLQESHRCYHCKEKFECALSTIRHCVSTHPENELSILIPYRSRGSIFHQARHFNVVCNTIQCEPHQINLQVDYRLILPQMEVVSTPQKKLPKPGTPCKSVSDAKMLEKGEDDSEVETVISTMQNIIPQVAEHIEEQMNLWMTFFNMIAQGTFPEKNNQTQNQQNTIFISDLDYYSVSSVAQSRGPRHWKATHIFRIK